MNTQHELYLKLSGRKLCKTLERGCDYFLLDTIGGIEYYTPNDETWGSIVAIDHSHKLACKTGFYDMDDMGYEGSDYAQVYNNGTLMCRFECS